MYMVFQQQTAVDLGYISRLNFGGIITQVFEGGC